MAGDNLARLSLKVWNFAMGLAGIATIFYGIFIFRLGRETSPASHQITIPWFFHAFLFVGIMLCAVTCLGHLAAKSANTCCLSTYIVVILVLLILETIMITDAFLNPNWTNDLPLNISGTGTYMDSVVSTDYIWKCLVSVDFLIQAICVLLAALSIHDHTPTHAYQRDYNDDEQTRIALLYPFARWQQADRHVV